MGAGELLGKPNKLRGSDLRWTSIPSRRIRNTPREQKPVTETGISSGSYKPVWLQGFTFWTAYTQSFLSQPMTHAVLTRKNAKVLTV